MTQKAGRKLVLGIDYGTDSCRGVIIDAADGSEIAQAVAPYPRWAKGLYCDALSNRFRQHPLDYVESLESVMNALHSSAGAESLAELRGIAIDTTGSTPCAVDSSGQPLALTREFAEDPDAMFVLWKDHTATAEAEEINSLARSWGGIDYTKYEGGIYSSEWFWAKIMRVFRSNSKVEKAAVSFVEHCDWMPALLTGSRSLAAIKRSRCAMGHKAMWHTDFGGYPSADFLGRLHPSLPRIRESLGSETWTSDQSCGGLSAEWAGKLHLPAGIPVAVGAYDAHMGAVGGGVREGVLVKVMGTSTCDMIVAPKGTKGERLVRGICGQVDGSVMPAMLGYEAGQSAFGDVYAWFKRLLSWPLEALLPGLSSVDEASKRRLAEAIDARIMVVLEEEAARVDPATSTVLALDWLNGRRTPDADQRLKGAIVGLTLGTTAPMVYRALLEATAYGARAIVERFREEGVAIDKVVGIGGVARKSALGMQIVADVLDMPIDIVGSDQSVALGAAMFASVAAGLWPTVAEAQGKMGAPIERTVRPDPARARTYDALYERYRKLGGFVEKELT
ncbi:MAG TPA: ribulokinase [Rectinemataceae bacterium]|nr:ribulokinase [Rectinemataceae bacterium]